MLPGMAHAGGRRPQGRAELVSRLGGALPEQLRSRAQRARAQAELGWAAARGRLRFGALDPADAVSMAFSMLLRRDPDPVAVDTFVGGISRGELDRYAVVQRVLASAELRLDVPFEDLLASMHLSRCQFVRGLPPAAQILDVGGTDQGDPRGAMVTMGYPYAFERLVIVDLPPQDRHELYRHGGVDRCDTALGPVEYRQHSMVDLSSFPDHSVDLVYSGQSIEHVQRSEGRALLGEVRRVLRPGGCFALDTPNGPIWRRRYPDALINPDHEVEYSHRELSTMLDDAGFEVVRACGLNYLGPAVAASEGFDEGEAARHVGVFEEITDCLNLAYVCRSPG